MSVHEALEHGEHAEHAAHGGSQKAALLVAVLAALLAICEQRAKHAEIHVEENSIGAADRWAQYQAKSIRSTVAKDLADSLLVLAPLDDQRAADLAKHLREESQRYEHGPDGKDFISKEAKRLEEERDHAIEQAHTYDNAAASLELGIVLSTASAITAATPLLLLAVAVGIMGVVFGLFGYFAPEVVAF